MRVLVYMLVVAGCRDSSILIFVFVSFLFFFNDTATTEIYTLSLHDALPIWRSPLLWVWKSMRATTGSKPLPVLLNDASVLLAWWWAPPLV